MESENNLTQHVKFISYTGDYPNLCHGILTLEINDKTYCFGHDYMKYKSWEDDGNHERFWQSGGDCGIIQDDETGDYCSSYINNGRWQIDASALPEEIRRFATEIDEVFNKNVPQGCCGGCL